MVKSLNRELIWATTCSQFQRARTIFNRKIPHSLLNNFVADWSLARNEESFYQLAFAAYYQFRKSLEPTPAWNFRLSIHPLDHQPELLA